ncbi:MAG: [acyl-carrier-protein] S-malonyltransferase [Gammaproteobacteria bacterium]|nr:MAG: [acyl-carrier-protein] S-malonyltransferase [Gammaproteobacteria bacterium]
MTAQAFVFPGQGSQSVGMLDSFRGAWPVVEETVAEANEALGFDIGALIAGGPAEQLNLTEYTQPAMLLAGVAVYRAWRAAGGEPPARMAGHSLGEYTAFVCAGAIEFAPALRLVRLRGQLMQAAVPEGEGGMAAVLGLDDETLRAACREAAGEEVVEAVNLNAPGQVVIAGHRSAIERALVVARERGARRGVFLPVSAPCHSSLMAPAADRLAEALADIEISPPAVPVVNNVDVAVPETPQGIREALVRQLHSPVRWVESIEWLAAQGVGRLVECGPGKVLTGLARRIDRRLETVSLHDADALAAALEGEKT